ncbi:unnamed protein product [Soboliphyme baturini]|uniref:Uncharacterized protein n=1 Tax=Soboliphyme baturini TaxID=241478 RepID=A0A183J7U2_9BILA|nr:unnamed protein product [Soboliphyme baturini]
MSRVDTPRRHAQLVSNNDQANAADTCVEHITRENDRDEANSVSCINYGGTTSMEEREISERRRNRIRKQPGSKAETFCAMQQHILHCLILSTVRSFQP